MISEAWKWVFSHTCIAINFSSNTWANSQNKIFCPMRSRPRSHPQQHPKCQVCSISHGQVLAHHEPHFPILLDHDHHLQGTWNSSYAAEPFGLFPGSWFSKLSLCTLTNLLTAKKRCAPGPKRRGRFGASGYKTKSRAHPRLSEIYSDCFLSPTCFWGLLASRA